MTTDALEIRNDAELPPITTRGRPRGVGVNIKLLEDIKGGKSVWDVPRNKMLSIKVSARLQGIPITVRRIPESGLYAIKRND